ncbi:MAG TPA: uracil-DNA glycosylase [Thermoplasmata archaeon]|nr:uracil-DNA glycosylase [Thermoplasmata archaeon]
MMGTYAGGPRTRPPAGWRRRWRALSREIATCQKCPLGRSRTHAVVYRGGLAPRIVFVGEAPGAAEDATGLPFVGRSGRRLDEAIRSLGLAAGDFGVLNLIKCRPPANRFEPRAASACRPYLERQLDLLAPERLVTLGAHALRVLDPSAPAMLQAAGRPRTAGRGPIFPMIHPAAALRSRQLAARWGADVERLGRWLRETPAQPV